MIVVLQTKTAGARPRRIQLRANQVAKVGRSEWADFSFNDDLAMSDVQFEIRSTEDACLVRCLSTGTPIFVNGEEIEKAAVHDGDEIRAGGTTFLVMIEGDRAATQPPVEAAPPLEPRVDPPPVDVPAAELSLAAICAYLEFADDITGPAAHVSSPDELIDLLVVQGKLMDALRLRAFTLPKREAVWWGCLCAHDDRDETLEVPQLDALRAAAAWVGQPDEENRRVAENRAAAANYSGVGATLALSAFWSGGSIAPEGGTVVIPDERLTSQGVAAALIAAAYEGDPKQGEERIRAFLATGKDVADKKILPPEKAPEW